MESFSNHFLISMPHIDDPIFSKSLILLCENNKEGSLGIIINKPMVSNSVAEIVQQTGLEKIKPPLDIYFGGPVNLQMGMVLHNSDYETEGTLHISNNLALTSNKQIIKDLRSGQGPEKLRFSMGYAGWGSGQLEKEIENGDWLLMPADLKIIFSLSDKDKWKTAVANYGIKVSDLGGTTGLA